MFCACVAADRNEAGVERSIGLLTRGAGDRFEATGSDQRSCGAATISLDDLVAFACCLLRYSSVVLPLCVLQNQTPKTAKAAPNGNAAGAPATPSTPGAQPAAAVAASSQPVGGLASPDDRSKAVAEMPSMRDMYAKMVRRVRWLFAPNRGALLIRCIS